MRLLATVIVGSLTLINAPTNAADWANWRGPDGLGVSSETSAPSEWGKDKNIAWKLTVPGAGASSPIVVGDRLYVSSQTEDTGLHLVAVDREHGTVIWDREIARGSLHANKLHNMATPTPASDGKLVWVMFGTGDVACLDREGKTVWQRNLVKEYGEYKFNHGYGSSPMLRDGKLFVVCMHQGPSYALALDAVTGQNLWKRDRNFEPKDEAQDSYSSPLFLEGKNGAQLVIAGAENVNAYDTASGNQVWVSGGMRVATPYGRTISGPTASGDIVVAVASGFGNKGFVEALRVKGDGAAPDRLWTSPKFSPDCPTPVIYGGNVFYIRDDGIASCVDLKTGEPYWQERLFSANVKVSPVAAAGKIYFMNGQGNCAVVKAATKLEILATNELNEATLCTPTISHGRVYIRTQEHLYCVN